MRPNRVVRHCLKLQNFLPSPRDDGREVLEVVVLAALGEVPADVELAQEVGKRLLADLAVEVAEGEDATVFGAAVVDSLLEAFEEDVED